MTFSNRQFQNGAAKLCSHLRSVMNYAYVPIKNFYMPLVRDAYPIHFMDEWIDFLATLQVFPTIEYN